MTVALGIALFFSVMLNIGLAGLYGDYRRRLSLALALMRQRGLEWAEAEELLDDLSEDMPN